MVMQVENNSVLKPFVAHGLGSFPLVSTACMRYKPELIVMLSNQVAWTIQELGEQIKDMLARN